MVKWFATSGLTVFAGMFFSKCIPLHPNTLLDICDVSLHRHQSVPICVGRRLPPEPPTPPRTPPLFGLPPLEPLGLPLGLGPAPPRKRKSPTMPAFAKPPMPPPAAAGRRPGDFLAAAGGLMPLPALKRSAVRDPRSQQFGPGQQPDPHATAPGMFLQRQNRPPPAPADSWQRSAATAGSASGANHLSAADGRQHNVQHNHSALGNGHAGPQAAKRPRQSPASSAATLTASEADGVEERDWSGANAAQSPPAAKGRKKWKKLSTGGRRAPPAARPGCSAADAQPAEDEDYLPLDM